MSERSAFEVRTAATMTPFEALRYYCRKVSEAINQAAAAEIAGSPDTKDLKRNAQEEAKRGDIIARILIRQLPD